MLISHPAALNDFFRSNALIGSTYSAYPYAFDQAEPKKKAIAIARIESASASGTLQLSTQVLHEFYNICTRKLSPALSHEAAAKAVHHLCEFSVIGSTPSSVKNALALVEQHQISWWDALILEAAIRADADLLLSEDGQHGRKFGKLRVENPFL